ncbi:MAG: DNA polymerase III subunit chi [Burkholderiales bacterium]|nr:DNA polymerase III subunit chi [Burkholderiales bacterium]
MSQLLASFYFNVANRDQALCQLAGKALKQQLAVGIVTASEGDSHALDRWLWELPATGFLPHCLADDPLAADTPVLLHHRWDRLSGRDVLFNWSQQDLAAVTDARRVIEVVARDDEAGRQAARARVAAYKAAGFVVDFTDMAVLHG